jgi:hypothetical protein
MLLLRLFFSPISTTYKGKKSVGKLDLDRSHGLIKRTRTPCSPPPLRPVFTDRGRSAVGSKFSQPLASPKSCKFSDCTPYFLIPQHERPPCRLVLHRHATLRCPPRWTAQHRHNSAPCMAAPTHDPMLTPVLARRRRYRRRRCGFLDVIRR